MDRKCLTVAVTLLAAACGGAPDDSPPASPHQSYVDMTFAERAEFMTDVVLPQMRETFAAFDAKFAKMSCSTCHGAGAVAGSYAMPSADVPKLPGSEEAFFEYVQDPEHARWSQFMMDRVWPQMAALLKVPMFDPATHADGFSCHNCHTLEGVDH